MRKKIFSILSFIILLCLLSCNKKHATMEFDINSLKALSNLAVLECSFNNVAKIIQPKGEGLLHAFEEDRKIFMEYEGQVKLGIDINEVINKYDSESKIIVIPKAKIISVIDNPYSYNNYISKDGIINKNTIQDKAFKTAITESKNKMELSIQNNNSLINRAQVLAEAQIKAFISTFGEFDIKYVRE